MLCIFSLSTYNADPYLVYWERIYKYTTVQPYYVNIHTICIYLYIYVMYRFNKQHGIMDGWMWKDIATHIQTAHIVAVTWYFCLHLSHLLPLILFYSFCSTYKLNWSTLLMLKKGTQFYQYLHKNYNLFLMKRLFVMHLSLSYIPKGTKIGYDFIYYLIYLHNF